VTQSGAAPGAGETRVHRLAIGIYDLDASDGSGKLVRVRREELDIEGPVTEVPALVGVSRGQLVLVNDDDLTYCSLRLDAESLRTALQRIADIAEPLPRSLVWSAAWEMTREAELRARDFVALVAGGVHAETEVGVAQRLLLQAQTALATAGDIDADGPATPFIDAEVQRDPTAAGKRHGAQAATARPQLKVKEEAWTTVVEDDTLANITARAIIAGIAPPAQHELLKPFTARYFEAISGVWARRSSEVAQTVVIGLYPHWDISDDGIAAADKFLSDPEVPAALRRLVLEGQAGVKRALRARRFDAVE
jgi:aminopeptidase N